ncbi:Ser/Thr protein phosphatase [Cordyceps militaris CM01]|uniref:Ser/Thr protein phosphatase n=1 Tax=Cordyceps militaris (strain CM01) TaxID=983644 RepID=G3J4V5_CORMM|nr:Ser/Thr protein phosphatase [Cordyceps militaris CM01]EGX95922.1 Ser/Thr protein phosphatase [Cordyceps militaris CM01]
MRFPLKRLLHRSWYSRVQVLSDLHLEIGSQYGSFTFPATAPYLLLAGDVGRLVDYDGYLGFLAAQTARYDAVLLVLGNHEFYQLSEAHARDAAWLREQVAGQQACDDGRRVLVATHHAPCVRGTSSPQHADSPWSSAFATEMLAEGDWAPVRTWVFGHTHYSTDMVRGGVRVVANQRGYVFPPKPGAVGSTMQESAVSGGFDPGKVVIV